MTYEIAQTTRKLGHLKHRLDGIGITKSRHLHKTDREGTGTIEAEILSRTLYIMNIDVLSFVVHLGTELLALGEPVTSEHLEIVAAETSDDIYCLGRALGFERAKVRDILSAYRTYDLKNSERLLVILEEWQHKDGRKATLRRLLEACDKIGKKDKVLDALTVKG